MARCKPHEWGVPEPGDDELVCEVCGHTLSFGEISPAIRSSIMNGVKRRLGKYSRMTRAFRDALLAAEDDALQRKFPALPKYPPPRSGRSAAMGVDPPPRAPEVRFPGRRQGRLVS